MSTELRGVDHPDILAEVLAHMQRQDVLGLRYDLISWLYPKTSQEVVREQVDRILQTVKHVTLTPTGLKRLVWSVRRLVHLNQVEAAPSIGACNAICDSIGPLFNRAMLVVILILNDEIRAADSAPLKALLRQLVSDYSQAMAMADITGFGIVGCTGTWLALSPAARRRFHERVRSVYARTSRKKDGSVRRKPVADLVRWIDRVALTHGCTGPVPEELLSTFRLICSGPFLDDECKQYVSLLKALRRLCAHRSLKALFNRLVEDAESDLLDHHSCLNLLERYVDGW